MAPHHGGQPSPPRAHRPRAPIMSVPVPLTAPLAPLRPPPNPSAITTTTTTTTNTTTSTTTTPSSPTSVTLTAPRPENERATNEYVETPFSSRTSPATAATTPPTPPPAHHHHHHHQHGQRQHRLQLQLPVTKQPTSFGKDAAASSMVGTECAARSSIMCPDCGRCRCESCQLPRPLPSRWVCGKTCLLSADSIIDYATCLCCVKALFYHYSEGDGDVSCADDPCGCTPDKRTARWGCLAALSCILPCLWCYWPLRGCKRAVEVCYARHSRQGCRCRPPQTTPEKRLLDSSPDF